jgi:hypothetical protein
MKRLLMALAAMVLMAVYSPASAQRLPGSANSELGCRELNAVMENSMEKGEDFFDCNKQDDTNYIHLKSPNACVRDYGVGLAVRLPEPPRIPATGALSAHLAGVLQDGARHKSGRVRCAMHQLLRTSALLSSAQGAVRSGGSVAALTQQRDRLTCCGEPFPAAPDACLTTKLSDSPQMISMDTG